MSEVIINLNNEVKLNVPINLIKLIDVLNEQYDENNNDENLLVINDKDITKKDLQFIINCISLYLESDSKQTDLPKPMPNNKKF